MSPCSIVDPSIIFSFSTIPVMIPTKSCSPFKYTSGISAVSPPTRDTSFSLHALAMPDTITSIIFGSSLSLAI